MQHSAHFVGRQVHIGSAIIALNKAMTIAMACHGPFEFFQHCVGGSQFFDTMPFFS
jgi:hypothetical protein